MKAKCKTRGESPFLLSAKPLIIDNLLKTNKKVGQLPLLIISIKLPFLTRFDEKLEQFWNNWPFYFISTVPFLLGISMVAFANQSILEHFILPPSSLR